MPQLTSDSRRSGFTLVELMIVTVLLGLVMGAMVRVVVRQQRFYRGASDIIDTRSQLRQAVNVLPADLRGLSRRGSGTLGNDPDLLVLSDSMIDARVLVGSAVACEATANTVTLPPASVAKDNAVTAMPGDLPQKGDFVFVFRDGDATKSSDDQWAKFQLSANATTSTTACAVSPYVTASDAGKPRIVATIGGNFGFTVPVGTPVRFARRVRYSLYKASDQKWYLGYRTWTGAAWNTVQPVSGPYRPYSTTAGESGLRFAYFDSAGASTATAANVARIDIVVRGESQAPIKIPGFRDGPFRDSLVTRVAIRNRN